MDRNDLCVENDQKENVCSESSSSIPHDVTPMLDFSELKPSQFGISVQSFIPSATPKGQRPATFCSVEMLSDCTQMCSYWRVAGPGWQLL